MGFAWWSFQKLEGNYPYTYASPYYTKCTTLTATKALNVQFNMHLMGETTLRIVNAIA